MSKQELSSKERLQEIQSKVEKLVDTNRKEVGIGKSITEIEETLFSEILDLGKLLLADRLIEEENKLENRSYEIEEPEKKKS